MELPRTHARRLSIPIVLLASLACGIASVSSAGLRKGRFESKVQPGPQVKAGEDSFRQYETIQKAIVRESSKLKIGKLKDMVSSPETETRVWVGFGLAYPRCVILRNLNGKQDALYIAPRIIGGNAALDVRGKVIRAKVPLPPPKSGWAEFGRFLKSKGIESPLRLSPDKGHVPDPDQESIVVEQKSQGSYNMVFFPLYTESKDGEKALAVCRRIEQEFHIRMGCGDPDSARSSVRRQ